MTNQTSPTPFPQFQPTQFTPGGVGVDFFQGGAAFEGARSTPGRNRIAFTPVRGYPQVIRYDAYFEDLSGGLDMMQTNIEGGIIPPYLADSELDHRYPRTLCLLPKIVSDTTSDFEMGNEDTLCVAFVEGSSAGPLCIVGGGDTADKSLFELNLLFAGISLQAKTYTPSAVVISLSSGELGATGTVRLIVGRAGAAAQVLSDLDNAAPTTDGTMHANLVDCWGVLVSPLNAATPGASTLIFLANDGVWTLSSTDAIGTAPTQILSNVPDGGFVMKIQEIPGSPVRGYMTIPLEDWPNSMLHWGSSGAVGKVFSVNLEGDEPQILDVGLPFVMDAKSFRNGVAATDGMRIYYHDGTLHDLGWNKERTMGAGDRQIGVVQLAPWGETLYAQIVETDTTSGTERYWWEEFDFERRAWYRTTKAQVTASSSSVLMLSASGLPSVHSIFDRQEGWGWTTLFWYDTHDTSTGEGWNGVQVNPARASNPFYARNGNATGAAEIAPVYEAQGTADTPIYHFFPGFKKVVSDIWSGAEMRGEDSKVTYTPAIQAGSAMTFTGARGVSFHEDDRWDKYWAPIPNPTPTDRIQLRITIDQGTSGTEVTHTTPNALPFKVGGYIYLDGNVIEPATLEPWRFQRD